MFAEMSTFDKIVIAVAVTLAATLIIVAISKTIHLCEEYSEWNTNRRRNKYRRVAYKNIRQERNLNTNRNNLWAYINREEGYKHE